MSTHLVSLMRALDDADKRGALPDDVRVALVQLRSCSTCAQAVDGKFTFDPRETLSVLTEHARSRDMHALLIEGKDSLLLVVIDPDIRAIVKQAINAVQAVDDAKVIN